MTELTGAEYDDLFATLHRPHDPMSPMTANGARAVLRDVLPAVMRIKATAKPDAYDDHCPTCDAPVPWHTEECAVPSRAAGWVSPEEHHADSDHTSCVEAYSALLERAERAEGALVSATGQLAAARREALLDLISRCRIATTGAEGGRFVAGVEAVIELAERMAADRAEEQGA